MNAAAVRLLTARPWAWLLAISLVTALLGWRASHLSIQEDLLDYWPEDDPELVRLEATLERFGLEGGGVLGLELDEPVFTPRSLARIDAWTRRLEATPGVDDVLSVTNVSTVTATGDDGIEVAPLVPDPIPDDPAALAAVADRARRDADVAGRLVSDDGRATAIFVTYREELPYEGELAIGNALWALARGEATANPDVRFHPTGAPAFLTVFRELTQREIRTLYPAVVGGMVLLLWASFRSVRAVAVPLAVVAVATIWTLGAFELAGRTLNSATIVVPAVVIVTSVADTIHVVNQYFESVRRAGPGAGPADRVPLMRATLERVLAPCFLTSATTVVGFLSLLLVDVPIIQEIGVFVAIGVVSAFLVSVTLAPACYVLGPLPAPRTTRLQTEGWIGVLLDRVARVVLRRPFAVAVVAGGVAIGGALGVLRLEVDFHWKEFVKEGHRVREAIRFLDTRLGGYDWLSVVLEVPAGGTGDLLEPERLAAVHRIREALREEPFVGHVDSVLSPLELANEVLHGGDPAYRRPPETRELAAQVLLLFTMGDASAVEGVLSFDQRATQLAARLISPGHARIRAWRERLEPRVAEIAAGVGLDAAVTGYSAIFATLNRTITVGLVTSLAGALGVISLMMALELRSVRLGLAAMVPNVIPVVTTLGLMGWLGIDLSGQTAMIGCIGIGLAVDDTIHFLHRFHRELRANGGDRRAAVEATLRSTGRALVFTSFVLFAGFSLLTLSAFVQFTQFGLLMAVTMTAALLGDLLLLPVLLVSVPWLTEPEAAAARRAGATAARPAPG